MRWLAIDRYPTGENQFFHVSTRTDTGFRQHFVQFGRIIIGQRTNMSWQATPRVARVQSDRSLYRPARNALFLGHFKVRSGCSWTPAASSPRRAPRGKFATPIGSTRLTLVCRWPFIRGQSIARPVFSRPRVFGRHVVSQTQALALGSKSWRGFRTPTRPPSPKRRPATRPAGFAGFRSRFRATDLIARIVIVIRRRTHSDPGEDSTGENKLAGASSCGTPPSIGSRGGN